MFYFYEKLQNKEIYARLESYKPKERIVIQKLIPRHFIDEDKYYMNNFKDEVLKKNICYKKISLLL